MTTDCASLKSEWLARFDLERRDLFGANAPVSLPLGLSLARDCDALLVRLAEVLAENKLERAAALTWQHGQKYLQVEGDDTVDGLLSSVAALEVLATHGVPLAADKADIMRHSAAFKRVERDLAHARDQLLRPAPSSTAHSDLLEAFDALTEIASAEAAIAFLAAKTSSAERERLVSRLTAETSERHAGLADQLRSCWADADARGLAKHAEADAKARELLRAEPPDLSSSSVEALFRFVDSHESALEPHVPYASPELVQQVRTRLDPLVQAIDARLAPFLDQIRKGRASTPEFRALLRETLCSMPERTRYSDPAADWFAALLGWRTRDGSSSRTKGWGNVASPVRWTLSLMDQMQPTSQDVVYDFGAGAGLVVALFGLLCDAKVCGIEFDPPVAEVARKTLERLRLPNTTFVEGDVLITDWSDGTIFHLYHPFFEPIASEVCDKLVQLGRKKPITVCWYGAEVFIQPILAEVQMRRWTLEPGRHRGHVIFRSQPHAATGA